jgi:hypothetical protein
MTFKRTAFMIIAATALAACMSTPPPRSGSTGAEPPVRGIPGPEVRDSVYLPVDRSGPPPGGYGLYTVVLTRVRNQNTARVLSEVFTSTGSAADAAIARENLNLITIPVKNAAQAGSVLATARSEPEAAATAVMQAHYDFDQAALLMSSVCRADRGAAVMKVCGSTAPDGPLLVTSQVPLTGGIIPGQRLLIVNLSATPTGALGEVLAAYRQQILRKDFADRAELDGWRLVALNYVLDAATMLPELRKAYVSVVGAN